MAQRNEIALLVRDDGKTRPWINAPPEWIDRLTAVLVDNACRYAGPGGTVRIAVTVAGSRVSLSVDDSGPGIAPEERSKLFDRFHRATDEGNGAGLGLAIADSVVRATGGEWRVGQSDLGGAHMEVSWHRSPGARGPGDPREAPSLSFSTAPRRRRPSSAECCRRGAPIHLIRQADAGHLVRLHVGVSVSPYL